MFSLYSYGPWPFIDDVPLKHGNFPVCILLVITTFIVPYTPYISQDFPGYSHINLPESKSKALAGRLSCDHSWLAMPRPAQGWALGVAQKLMETYQ